MWKKGRSGDAENIKGDHVGMVGKRVTSGGEKRGVAERVRAGGGEGAVIEEGGVASGWRAVARRKY